jgi:glycosyltransferase involved in cell wall biosynthesis
MAEEYRERFKRPCEAFLNCADLRQFAVADGRPDRGLRFAYVGGLHLDRWRNLKEIGDALSRASGGSPVPAQLLIHAPAADLEQYAAALRESTGILLAEPLAPTDVPGALSRSDVLVHVESFRPEVMAYCRLSLSTKIPQYLAAGRPVLCYGPAALASCQYILRLGAGIVVGEQNTAALTAAVVRLRDDRQLRHCLGANARAAAERHHDARAQRERFRALLCQTAKDALAAAATSSSRAGVSAQLHDGMEERSAASLSKRP